MPSLPTILVLVLLLAFAEASRPPGLPGGSWRDSARGAFVEQEPSDRNSDTWVVKTQLKRGAIFSDWTSAETEFRPARWLRAGDKFENHGGRMVLVSPSRPRSIGDPVSLLVDQRPNAVNVGAGFALLRWWAAKTKPVPWMQVVVPLATAVMSVADQSRTALLFISALIVVGHPW